MNKISYWAVIPANVRYDKLLNNGAKLLFGEISALCNKEGYCWATNEYFSELYGYKHRMIQYWIRQLEKGKYITITNGKGKSRKIFITSTMTELGELNRAKNCTSPCKILHSNRAKNCTVEGVTLYKNNISNNKKEYSKNSFLNIPGMTEEVLERRTKKFEELFQKYPRQTKRRESLRMFLEMIDTDEKYKKVKQAVKRYADSYEVYKGRIMNFTNFLPDYEYWAKYTED
jgi:hypothetical protein